MSGSPAANAGFDNGDEVPEVVRALAGEMLARSSELAIEMAAHLHRQIPELGGSDLELLRETRASCESNIVQSYRLLMAGGDVDQLVVTPEAAEYVRGFVARGIKVPVLLRTYRLGHALTWERWSDALRERVGNPDQLAAAIEYSSRWMFAYIDMVSAELVEDFANEQARLVRSAEQVRTATVRSLLDGELVDDEVATSRLGYKLERRQLGLHVWSERDEAGGLERAANEASALAGCKSPLIVNCGAAALDVWCGFSDTPAAEQFRRLAGYRPPEGIRLGCGGGAAAGIGGFRLAHEQARQAARVAMLAGARLGEVTSYEDVELVSLLLADTERARRFMAGRLGPLAADDAQAARLRETVLAYLRHNRSSGQAAKQLFVHQNTVNYRIRGAEELLGRPVSENQEELLCALTLAAVLGPPGEPAAEPPKP